MSNWSPPSIPRNWLAALVILYVLFLGYSTLVMGQILLGVFPALGLVFLYLLWRFISAVEAIADAQQRLAYRREQN